MPATLSVILPVYNEEKNIENCLKSVSWADEIIVVDGGSKDTTREIAARYTPHILITENAPAETQRLKGLAKMKGDWFFLIDADERVSADLRKQIQDTIHSSQSKSAYYVLRCNLYRNRQVHLHHPDYQLRLFRKIEGESLPERIHRIPRLKGSAGVLKGSLEHYFFTSVQDYLAKLNRYTLIEASYWKEEGRQIKGWKAVYYLVFRPLGRFFQYYFLKKGFRDGFFGFFYSASSAYYEIIVAALVMGDAKD